MEKERLNRNIMSDRARPTNKMCALPEQEGISTGKAGQR